ncbi:CiaB protein [Aquipluma nitroreducens]|uniref:CiaB protein n=2 Tax=Aquipluma nitroreducens TaxID=2010828 RepID=A0A5K7SAN4_9BACT|nr:CiaB protein [Aquipluma nitroreducens]
MVKTFEIMAKDLTSSGVARQNILNNTYALQEIQKAVGMEGVLFENEYRFTKKQLAQFFEVSERTINNCLANNEAELAKNGYGVLSGKRLINFKLAVENQFDPEMDFMIKTVRLGVFNFRAFLNLSMLLTDSEKAKEMRSTILDIVIDTINKRTGGGTKYINQRDEDFVINLLSGEDYRKEFTDALRDYVAMGNFKYIVYTNKIYSSIFKENADEYRKILKLDSSENVRHTMYSEVLDLISSYETGFADILRAESLRLNRKLTSIEVDTAFHKFEQQKLWEPFREKARQKMASRDLCFRDALHQNLEEYISSVPKEDFDRFLGEKSKDLEQRLEEYKEALKRLKERD